MARINHVGTGVPDGPFPRRIKRLGYICKEQSANIIFEAIHA